MKQTATIALVLATAVSSAASAADSRIERFCGAGHQNEMASLDDVKSIPDGYYVVSIAEQVSEGDPRIVLTNNPGFHLCTRPVATPGMTSTDVFRLGTMREVKFLFVPITGWKARPSS